MGTTLHILHLEDNPDDQELVRLTLVKEGMACELACVESHDDFLAALKQGEWDIILADYTLPSYDGLSAFRLAREVRSEGPLIFVSGTIGEEAAIGCLKAGATDYVLKHRLALLGHAVRRALREAEERKERKLADEDRTRQEEQLRQAHKMEAIGRLAGGIAHDFNNLLTVINGYSELVLNSLGANLLARKNVEQIKKAGRRAATLTRQLLAFSRRQVLQLKVLDLNAVVTNFEAMLQPLIGEDILLEAVLQPRLGLEVRHHGIQVQHFQLQNLSAAESQKLACQGCGPTTRFLDLFDVLASKEIGTEAVEHKFTVAVDDRQQVVEVMRDAAGKPSDRLHFVSLTKLLFQSSSVFVRQLALLPFLSLAQGTTHCMGQSCEVVFQHIVCGAGLQTSDRCILSDGAGNKDEGDFRAQFPRESQRRQSIVGRERVVGQDDVPLALLQSGEEVVVALDARQLARHAFFDKRQANQFLIIWIVFKMKDVQRRSHTRIPPQAGGPIGGQDILS